MTTFDNVLARAAIWQMRHLPRGWDSYDACQISETAIQAALRLLEVLPGCWHAVPVSDGSVQLEQHSDGVDIEIICSRHNTGVNHD